MRTILFPVFLVAFAMAIGYGLFATGPLASVLGAIWTLIAVVAMVGRGILDALHRNEAGAQPSGEPGDRGGVQLPGWLK
jgi:hypothetical protein